ncbi:MAG: YhbY family RNA-binding protein [Nanoarchaeota archaeon]
MISEAKFQIGKNGVTDGVIKSLNLCFKTYNQIRISLLKSAERDREKMRDTAINLAQRVEYYCNYKVIGFTIILRRRSSRIKKPLR